MLRVVGFEAPHGFTLRAGGVSAAPYDTLNLGLSTGDDPGRVARNRERALAACAARPGRVHAVRQVHGARVAPEGAGWFEAEADAVTSATPGDVLLLGAADCLPLLVLDPRTGAAGAAHCGWRGLASGVVDALVDALRERYGAAPAHLRSALLPAIAPACYQVGPEVAEAFREGGFPAALTPLDDEGRHRLDLTGAVRHALGRAGVEAPPHEAGSCTHCEPRRFFSHRRDGRRTGRHWAWLRVPGR